MFSISILSMFMLGFIGTFIQSRRVTESSVLHAAATSMIYGIIEQIKTLDYTTSLPYNGIEADPDAGIAADPTATDPSDPNNTLPPFVRVRINQNKPVWLRAVYTPITDEDPDTEDIPAPVGPTTTPAASASADGVGTDGSDAIDNWIGSIPLSTITGTTSQQINLNIWLWIDGIPNVAADVSEVKKITVVYTYSYQDGGKTRTIRDREVFLRTRYEQ